MLKLTNMFFVLSVLFFAASVNASPITGTNSGQATRYDVTITKVELCRSATCTAPFVLGSSSKVFDIASASVGEEVGKFIDLEGIPLFQTWSHVRVTMSTSFVISGDDGTCKTNGGSGTRAAFLAGAASGGAVLPATMQLPNQATVQAVPGLAGFNYSTYGITQTDGASQFTMTIALASPYTCKGELPRIDVKFDTSQAFGHGGGACTVTFPQPPTVTITAEDP